MPYIVRVKKEFQAAHFLTDYYGKPEPLHGHTWEIEVFIRAERLDKGGMGYDFIEIDKFLDEILPNYKCMNDIYDFSPSAENLAKYFYEKVKEKYPTVEKVVVWETNHCGAEYYE
ncbi:MAG: 6-pyruvoyl tetrahydrobiopterin synthase [Persephonella sp.]|nr:MAG: 6-pyruvoyl tetrahydrobiopterin synthase [Persephonella sp.]RUM59188.1 MAG: 6-pyruvoyl tetrahydrobiopterin synthase [Persephonella sp.]